MEMLNAAVSAVNNVLWSYVLIVVLVGCGLWFTFSTRFVQLRMLPEMVRLLVSGIGTKTPGISSFQAFCVSTASRVGVGNIAGVAIAIVTGGPGAVFWMWVIAFFGCATGFTESTLAQIYKLPRPLGLFHGGPAYYIKNALHQPGVARLFAVLLAVTFGFIYVSVQSNTIAQSLQHAVGISPVATAGVLAVLTGLVIFGGVRRIAQFTEYLVPIMAGLYILAAIAVVLMNLSAVPDMFALILHDAFSPQAAVGGGLGTAVLTGIKRGLFSNEAGEGSVPNAAATADVSHPVQQGLVQAFGVYVDTWIVCSATAFIILLTGQYTIGGELTGVALAQQSLASVFGALAPTVVAIMVFLFAFSSIVGNYYYGEINVPFFGKNAEKWLQAFRVGVILMVIFGALAELNLVWNLADLFMAFLCLTNLYAVARLAKYTRIALADYTQQKAAGKKEPTFDPRILGNTDGMHAWGVDK
ncbi:MAG: alanine:cation symporter family protein [Selenomonas sp.]|jgi:AGCS family alanine or glycine:cation symporter|nr:alanine:cation symporter family protein [Selenomonas sp.]MCI7331008.1 alanine:cation symporter family protein [Selenomonadaceae bacterium]MDD6119081.1 alanine/glycine:cation symporter family protein [Selenomonadaceae bacterium]MDD7057276.1 alanine/glycine:cation symporter family protein [Selenomonadaceae bacterium]MDY3915394.1 alanine/glycine:cation symporter family protein [Selenomonadaceae bacterium]